MSRGGLQTKMFYSVQKDEVYVKIRASMTRLKLEAARIGYKVRNVGEWVCRYVYIATAITSAHSPRSHDGQ